MNPVLRIGLTTLAGAVPGTLLVIWGNVKQGIAVAILGALVGLGVAFSSAVTGTSIWQESRRHVRLVLHTLLRYNLPGIAAKIVPIDHLYVPSAERIVVTSPRLLEQRIYTFGIVGAILGIAAGSIAAQQIVDPNKSRSELIGDFAGVTISVAALCGLVTAALASLTISGPHRVSVPISMVVGILIGVAVWFAVHEGGRISPVQALCWTVGIFGGFSLLFSLMHVLTICRHADDDANQDGGSSTAGD